MSFIPCDGERSLSVGYEFTAGISDMTSGHGRARLSGTCSSSISKSAVLRRWSRDGVFERNRLKKNCRD